MGWTEYHKRMGHETGKPMPKLCEICGAEIPWRTGLSHKVYDKLRTCGRKACVSKLRSIIQIGKPHPVGERGNYESKYDYGRPGAFIKPWKGRPCNCRTCYVCGRVIEHRKYWVRQVWPFEACDVCQHHYNGTEWTRTGRNEWRGVRIPRYIKLRRMAGAERAE